MEISIRPATRADACAISRILINLGSWDWLCFQNAPEIEEKIKTELENTSPDRSRYVATDSQGGILGYTAVSYVPYLFFKGREGYITELFVAQEARGHGVGSVLLEKVKQEARERGCSRLLLHNLRSRESYQRNFYAKQGWEERGNTAIFIYEFG